MIFVRKYSKKNTWNDAKIKMKILKIAKETAEIAFEVLHDTNKDQ